LILRRARNGLELRIEFTRKAGADMCLIELELVEELFTSAEKKEIINQLKNAMVMIRNEGLRSPTNCIPKEQLVVRTRST
jgi:hypothetical protein